MCHRLGELNGTDNRCCLHPATRGTALTADETVGTRVRLPGASREEIMIRPLVS